MNAICKTKDLLQACAFAGSICKARTTLPALNHIRLTADKGEISVFGSNLEIFKTQRCLADVKEGFDLGLPGSLFIAFLRSISAEQVEMTVEKDSMRLKANSSTAKILKIDGKEFPQLPKVSGQSFTVPADELQKKLRQVVQAAHTDADAWRTRCAVWFEFTKKGLELTAFDGKRLATTRIDAKGKGGFIVPTELVNEIVAVDEPGEIQVTLGDHALFAGETWEIRGKLIDAQIMNWREADVMYQFKDFATVSRDALSDCLKRALLFTPTNPNQNNATTFEFTEKALTIALDRGNGIKDVMPCSGSPLTIPLDPQAVLKAISFVESDDVKIGLIDHLSPIQISDGDYRVLTMPFLKT